MQKLNVLLCLAVAAYSGGAIANNDKDAGICAGYMAFLKRDQGMYQALLSADNQHRATNHAKTWMQSAERHNTPQVAAIQGDSACRRIGIRASDYK
jgi:hypothetical protein